MAAINILLQASDKYSAAVTGLNQGLELIGKGIRGIGTAADVATGGIGLIFKALTSLTSIALSPITFAFDAMYNSVILVKDAIYGLFDYLWSGLKSVAGFTWDTITSLSGYLYDSFKESLSYIWDTIKAINNFAWQTTKDFVANFASSLYETGNTFEQLQVRMEAIFGGSGAAKAALDWAVEFGAKTPLTLDQVASAMVKLKTFGFDPMDGTLQKLGDAAFALGTDFDGVVTALGQMQLKGKVSAEELMQLAERNVPVYEILRQKFNLTAEQLGNIGKVGLDVNEAVKAIVDGLGTRFTGAMEKASGTAQGALSTIEDIWIVFQKKIADSGAWDQVVAYIVKIRDYLGSVLGGFSGNQLAGQVGDAINYVLKFMRQNRFAETFIDSIVSIASDSIRSLQSVLPEIMSAVKILFNESLIIYKAYISNIGGTIQGLTPYILDIIEKLPDIRKAFFEVANAITGFIGTSMPYAINLIKDAFVNAEVYGKATIATIKDLGNYANQIGLSDALFEGFDYLQKTIVDISNILSQKIYGIDWHAVVFDVVDGIKIVFDYAVQIGKKIFEIKDIAMSIFGDINNNLPEVQNYFKVLFQSIIKAMGTILDVGFSIGKDLFKSAKAVGLSTVDVVLGIVQSLEGITDSADKGVEAWRTWAEIVNKIFFTVLSIFESAFNAVFGRIGNLINKLKGAVASIAPDIADKIPDIDLRITGNELLETLKNMAINNLKEIGDARILEQAEKNLAEQQREKLRRSLDGVELTFDNADIGLDRIKDSLKDVFDIGKAGFMYAGDYLKDKTKDLKFDFGKSDIPGLPETEGYYRIVMKLDDGTEKIIEKGIPITGDIPKIELPTQKLDVAKLDIKDKKVGIDFDESSLDKLKGELLVSLKDDKEIQSGLNENEILLALTKLLKAQLVADATGEGLPVITYS